MYCSPSRENLALSCYNDMELEDIYQKTFSVSQIKDREEMVKELTSHFKKQCKNDQSCWTNDEKLIERVFRPLSSWGKDGWLSDRDIDSVLSQYEDSSNKYCHLGCERVDFWYRSKNDLRHTKFTPLLEKGIKKFSLVILLYGYRKESYYQEHWVSIFIDLPRKTIDYFDSSNFDVIPAMEFLLFEIQLQLILTTGINFVVNKCTYALQKYDGDCGIFSIDFIVRRLSGMTFQGYMDYHKLLDISQKEYMKSMRIYYFRK